MRSLTLLLLVLLPHSALAQVFEPLEPMATTIRDGVFAVAKGTPPSEALPAEWNARFGHLQGFRDEFNQRGITQLTTLGFEIDYLILDATGPVARLNAMVMFTSKPSGLLYARVGDGEGFRPPGRKPGGALAPFEASAARLLAHIKQHPTLPMAKREQALAWTPPGGLRDDLGRMYDKTNAGWAKLADRLKARPPVRIAVGRVDDILLLARDAKGQAVCLISAEFKVVVADDGRGKLGFELRGFRNLPKPNAKPMEQAEAEKAAERKAREEAKRRAQEEADRQREEDERRRREEAERGE